MKKYIPLLLFLLCGCGVRTPYFIKKYHTNEVKEVPLGAVMMSWEYGTYNLSSYEKLEARRRELLFSGRAGNTIYITYQEFYLDERFDMNPKATYTKVYPYNIDSVSVIAYEDVRIHVIAATETTIRYRVTRGPKWFEEYIKDTKELYY